MFSWYLYGGPSYKPNEFVLILYKERSYLNYGFAGVSEINHRLNSNDIILIQL